MKKLYSIIVAVLMTASVFAQSPDKMSYQAVIRDASDILVTDQAVGMKISILRGSASRTAAYVETQIPTTNANGLVTVEIGSGTVVSGDFTTIDWANETYFIKTETDPTGGTSYSITGTSQLLSVPYALHAKTANNTFSGNYTDLSNTPTTITTAQSNAISDNRQAIQDTAAQIRADIPSVTSYSVGDFAQGGIVFWVDETGQHGLVCAIEDQNGGSGIQWYNGTNTDTEAHGDGVYGGEMNTMLIISNQGSNSNDYAAGVCANYAVAQNGITYGDWYLPSKEELNLMYENKAIINAIATANGGSVFADVFYWNSTEVDINLAQRQGLLQGAYYDGIKSLSQNVRAIRAF